MALDYGDLKEELTNKYLILAKDMFGVTIDEKAMRKIVDGALDSVEREIIEMKNLGFRMYPAFESHEMMKY